MIKRFERFSLALSEVNKYWHKLAGEEMEKNGLKAPHSVYIIALSRKELTASQLCEACGRDKADVSRMVNDLMKKNLVYKEGSHYKGVYKLTEKGQEIANNVQKRASKAVEMAGKDLSEENRRIFYEAFEMIAANLKELSKNGIPQ